MSFLDTCILQLFNPTERDNQIPNWRLSSPWLELSKQLRWMGSILTPWPARQTHSMKLALFTLSWFCLDKCKPTTDHMVYSIANLKITTQPFPLVRKNWSFCLFQEISFTCIEWIKLCVVSHVLQRPQYSNLLWPSIPSWDGIILKSSICSSPHT